MKAAERLPRGYLNNVIVLNLLSAKVIKNKSIEKYI